MRDFFAAIESPVLLIRGDQSDRGERDLQEWAKVFQDARVVILPGVGHWVQHERPDELVEMLRDFLALPKPVAGD